MIRNILLSALMLSAAAAAVPSASADQTCVPAVGGCVTTTSWTNGTGSCDDPDGYYYGEGQSAAVATNATPAGSYAVTAGSSCHEIVDSWWGYRYGGSSFVVTAQAVGSPVGNAVAAFTWSESYGPGTSQCSMGVTAKYLENADFFTPKFGCPLGHPVMLPVLP